MLLSEVKKIVDAEVLCLGVKMNEIDLPTAYASDLLSDVLAFASPGCLLITGLTNLQIVRTAQMMDIPAILFVRGKVPPDEVVEIAQNVGIPMLLTYMTMYEACGRLYVHGLPPQSMEGRKKQIKDHGI